MLLLVPTEVVGLAGDAQIDAEKKALDPGRTRHVCDEGMNGHLLPHSIGPKVMLPGIYQGCTGVDLG